MQWMEITGVIKDAHEQVIENPADEMRGTWYPEHEKNIKPRPVIYQAGGWWTQEAHRSQFAK